MKSMTGYAYKEHSDNKITVSVELKCYNSRFLDLSIHLPGRLSVLESDMRKFISQKFVHGKIEAGIRVKVDESDIDVTINKKAALVYHSAISDLAESLNMNEKPNLGMILHMEGVLETETKRDAEKYRELIWPVLEEAIEQADIERIREGEHTKADILKHIEIIAESEKIVIKHVPEI